MEKTNVAIIGSGPSGYTAGVYTSRANLAPVLFAGQKSGGQLMWTTEVENYPGFKDGITGPQLMSEMRAQAERFGTKIIDQFITAVDFSQRPFKLWTTYPAGKTGEDFERATPEQWQQLQAEIKQSQPAIEAEAVIITTGASSIMLGVPGELEFLGRGVSTCAVCDAAFYRDKDTYVVGGGDSAMEDTLALTKFAKSVTVIHRRDAFKASKIMQDRVLNHPKVKVIWNSSVTEVMGDKKITGIKVQTQEQNSRPHVQDLSADGLFIAIGHRPMSSVFAGQIELDSHGYVITRQSYTQQGIDWAKQAIDEKGFIRFPTMTTVEGVFAGGDVVDIRYRQAITAAGQGCMAALDAERWLEAVAS
ncbi:MAG TPA: FAD-dependent oxidoreductase [Patescibacteria group bacterium]